MTALPSFRSGRATGLRNLLCGAAVALALGVPGVAEATSLNEALAQAYAGNPQLRSQRAFLRSVDESVPQALSNWRPTISASGNVTDTRNENDQATFFTEETNTTQTAVVSVTQPIFRGGRTIAQTRAAEARVDAERARLHAVEQTVLLSAATAYLDVVRDQAVVELNINNEQVLQRQLEATQDRFRVGEITRTDVSQAEARLAGATASRIRSEGNLQASRAAYRSVIGDAPNGLDAPAPDSFPALPETLDTLLTNAEEGNPNVRAALSSSRAADRTVAVNQGALLPTLSVQGSISKTWNPTFGGDNTEQYQAIAQVSVPLYQSGAAYSRIREAKQLRAQSREEVERQRRLAEETATRAWETLTAARASIQSINKQIEAAEIALEGVSREAEVGSRTVLDVLDAEQELLDARVSLVRARRDETVAVFQVLAAKGGLTADNLGLDVQYYDPERNYRRVRGQWFGADVD